MDDVTALTQESEALLEDIPVLSPNLRHPLTLGKAREVVAERLDALIAAAQQEARAGLVERVGGWPEMRGYIAHRLAGGQEHEWDYNYQCLRCGRYEHDQRIKEPCPGTSHAMSVCCSRHSAEIAEAAVADYLAALPRPEEPRVDRCAFEGCPLPEGRMWHDNRPGNQPPTRIDHPFTPEAR